MKPTRFQANSPLDRVRRRRGLALASGGRTFSEVEQRMLKQLVPGEQDFIDNPVFYAKDAERRIFELAPAVRKPDASWYHPVMDDLNLGRARLPKTSDQVILTGAEEKILFLQFNYARFMIARLQDAVRASEHGKPTHEQCEGLLRWYRKADELREQIAETNLALVLAMAKRTRMSEVDFADLVSEGNMALLRAVDKFDCERGFKFSTYACRAILKAFSRQGMKLSKYRQRFPTDFDPKMEKSNHLEVKRGEFQTDAAAEVKRLVLENRCELTDIERTVIEHRFRLESPDPEERPMTLEQVGQIIGVTKERVRQIQNKALEKIRIELEHQFMGKPKPEPTEGEIQTDPLTAQAVLN
jgi:RNA polymerase sigma factor (sigma-70 family)